MQHGILEAIAGVEARGYAELERLGATPVQRVRTCGGGGRNPTYTRIRQRLLGAHVDVQAAEQLEAAFGAARIARRGFGLCEQGEALG